MFSIKNSIYKSQNVSIKGFTLLECIIASSIGIILLSILLISLVMSTKTIFSIFEIGHTQQNAIISFMSFKNDIQNCKILFDHNKLIIRTNNNEIHYFIDNISKQNNEQQTTFSLYRYETARPRFSEEIIQGIDHWKLSFTMQNQFNFFSADEIDQMGVWEEVNGVFIQLLFKPIKTFYSKKLLHYGISQYVHC